MSKWLVILFALVAVAAAHWQHHGRHGRGQGRRGPPHGPHHHHHHPHHRHPHHSRFHRNGFGPQAMQRFVSMLTGKQNPIVMEERLKLAGCVPTESPLPKNGSAEYNELWPSIFINTNGTGQCKMQCMSWPWRCGGYLYVNLGQRTNPCVLFFRARPGMFNVKQPEVPKEILKVTTFYTIRCKGKFLDIESALTGGRFVISMTLPHLKPKLDQIMDILNQTFGWSDPKPVKRHPMSDMPFPGPQVPPESLFGGGSPHHRHRSPYANGHPSADMPAPTPSPTDGPLPMLREGTEDLPASHHGPQLPGMTSTSGPQTPADADKFAYHGEPAPETGRPMRESDGIHQPVPKSREEMLTGKETDDPLLKGDAMPDNAPPLNDEEEVRPTRRNTERRKRRGRGRGRRRGADPDMLPM